MKKTKLLSGIFLAMLLLFSSCSKEDDSQIAEKEKAYLSFQTLLKNLTQKQQTKQMDFDVPECVGGIPAFVEIILTHGDVYVVGTETTPFRLNLDPNSADTDGDGTGDYFTEEHAILELDPATYTLEYFTVLDADENVIWIAPMNDHQPGGIDDMVEHSLPMDINLGPGVKKYQDVEVVCFNDRIVNQYGYLFFDLNGYQVIEFCIFGNYCDESGRHQEFILYEVDVWKYSGEVLAPKGTVLHEDLQNEVIVTDYEDYAETNSFPLCLTLPDGPGLDEYYVEITQINLGAENVLIRSGLISDADVRNLFRDNGTMDYYHFREGNCNSEDTPDLLDLADAGPQECTTINFEDLPSHSSFNSEYYASSGVSILAGPGFSQNAMKIMAGTCSENVLHSRDYPFASVLFNFSSSISSVSLVAGDYGEDQDTISVTAYTGENGQGDVVTAQTRILEEDTGGCLEFSLGGEGIRSVVVYGKSDREGHDNTIFTDNLTFCR